MHLKISTKDPYNVLVRKTGSYWDLCEKIFLKSGPTFSTYLSEILILSVKFNLKLFLTYVRETILKSIHIMYFKSRSIMHVNI